MHLLCGVAWGLGPGFAIVVAGTLLGEIGNYLCVALPSFTFDINRLNL